MARNIRGYVKRLQEPEGHGDYWKGYNSALNDILSFIDSMEEEPDPNILYASREAAIQAHAEDYSFNIESELFQQLTKEQQKLWRKEIEQACISGGYCGLNLQKDTRYDDNLEVKEVEEIIHTVIAECCDWLAMNTNLSHDKIEGCRNLMLTVKEEQFKAQKRE